MRKLPAATNDSNARRHDRNNIRNTSASQLRDEACEGKERIIEGEEDEITKQ